MVYFLVVVILSLIFATTIFVFAWRERDLNGNIKPIAQLIMLISIAIPSSWLVSFLVMLFDSDRLREGDQYWFLAVQLFLIISFIGSFIILLLWWGLTKVFKKNKWLPAVISPLPFLILAGPYGVLTLMLSCFAASYLFKNKN